MPNPQRTSRKAIVAAAVEILERDGAEALSMRAVARWLGLAPNALYNYFPDRTAMEAAMATEGLRRLHGALKTAVRGAADPEALRRSCRVYLRFARKHSALYAVMMRRHPDTPGLVAARARFGDLFRALFRSLEDPRFAQTAAFAAWALLHGTAALGDLAPPAASFSAIEALIAALSRSSTR